MTTKTATPPTSTTKVNANYVTQGADLEPKCARRLVPEDLGRWPQMGAGRDPRDTPGHEASTWGIAGRAGGRRGSRRGARSGLGAPPAPIPTIPKRPSRMPPGPEACRCTHAQNGEGG